MKTQISRNVVQPDKPYSGVYQQQGRMITDADWNALTDIEKQRLVDALKDAVASGIPADGGLALEATEAGLMVNPGRVYVEGVPAALAGESVNVAAQPDYPDAPAFSGKNLQLYADVWERAVTALEDPDLMDPALHGADTTTRSRTMLQIKWCENGVDLTDPEQLPAIGDGKLALRLRRISVADDPCDPCASELNLDERVGNYLFRVEVHDRDQRDGKDLLTLKWSRDNGAEAYAVDNFPPGFDQGDWIWEFFDTNSEKCLGHHFAFPADYAPRRGVLNSDFEIPETEPNRLVRQWDGYALINMKTGVLMEGSDRGHALSESASSDTHGFVAFDNGRVTINGERLEMILAYEGRKFLAGDFWQAAVRETEQGPGDWVLGSQPDEENPPEGEGPVGVQHHYLRLGALDGAGNLNPFSDAEKRRFSFPPLTDIPASHVSFQDRCDGLFHGAENVQEALDNLCGIGAEDIAYEPACDTDVSVAGLLADSLGDHWPDLDGDEKASVKDMLDALLCRLNARHVPLDKREDLCPDLADERVTSVQDALSALCARDSGGGCALVVEPGELEDILARLIEQEAVNIWLCLKPGEHRLTKQLDLHARNIRITGMSSSGSVVVLDLERWHVRAEGVQLSNVGFRSGAEVSSLAVATSDLRLENTSLFSQQKPALLSVTPLEKEILRLNLRGSTLDNRVGIALEIQGVIVDGQFHQNRIYGEIHHRLGDTGEPGVDPGRVPVMGSRVTAMIVIPIQREEGHTTLALKDNYIQRWVSFIAPPSVDDGILVEPVHGVDNLFISNNTFELGSSFIGAKLTMLGNHFQQRTAGNVAASLWAFANQAIIQSNTSDKTDLFGRYAAMESLDVDGTNLMQFEPL